MADDQRTALRRGEIGFVYQFHHLLPEFSALENIMLPQMIAGFRGARRRERAWAIAPLSWPIGARANIGRPNCLAASSSGSRSRARSPTARGLLLADEPTGNLDPKTASHVFEALDTIVRATGLAALIATHNMELAQAGWTGG